MSITVSSSNLLPEDALPILFFAVNESTTSLTESWANNDRYVAVLLGMDAVCSEDEPVQCFCNFSLENIYQFYWDSQSTGEGLGVRFQWRGQIPVPFGWHIYGTVTASSPVNISILAWGVLVARDYRAWNLQGAP